MSRDKDRDAAGKGISRRTDRAIRRAARKAGDAASSTRYEGRANAGPDYSYAGVKNVPYRKQVGSDQYELCDTLRVVLTASWPGQGRPTALAAMYFDTNGRIDFKIDNLPEEMDVMAQVWWGDFLVTEERPDRYTTHDSAGATTDHFALKLSVDGEDRHE